MLEIVGLAGAGKSSLKVEIMSKIKNKHQDSDVNTGCFLSMLWVSICSLVFSLRYAPKTKFWFMNFRSIYWLHKTLYGKSIYSDKVFDQGPIFHIAFLRSIGSQYDSSRFCEKYYSNLVSQLSKKLKYVVFLEVDFETAIARCQQRQKNHSLKNRTKESAIEFLSYFQVEYNLLIEQLEKMGVKILKIDSVKNSESEVFLKFKNNFSRYLYV